MQRIELEVIDAFLESPWGTPQMHEALDNLIRLADTRRAEVASGRGPGRPRKEGSQ